MTAQTEKVGDGTGQIRKDDNVVTQSLEWQRLELEREKLRFERQGVLFRYVAILGAIGTFIWGAYTHFDGLRREQAKQAGEREQAIAVQKIAASQPFLERQLKLFEEATQVAAYLSTVSDSPDRAKKSERFEQLYWGELALVEKGPVEAAMVQFRKALMAGAPLEELRRHSLAIAHACREELAESWGVSHWKRP
ncbi:hypothetical protein [Roseimicrobium sp. ORNL1]|uniref:hypothetical protein n=1 Tax=Roseimicrobium sp. ORNL1 TaxID=2711231 RepID=UPI0013E1FEFC|nr:hypothetical protein [Roseimicrobium sp. ORNL1]QIF02168.1 hypothetical protein G5S37_11710 [Roseimicrobium sp. ORNL1]